MTDERKGLPSASSIYRLAACPGSHNLSQGIEAFRTQEMIEWAEAGDRIHEVLAGLRMADTLSPEDQEQVERHIRVDNWIFEKTILSNQFEAFREQRLWLSADSVRLLSGKADLIAIDRDTSVGLVVDYKTNRGQQDPADENWQVLTNIVLSSEEYDFVETWYGAINQPLETMEPVIVKFTKAQVAEARAKLIEVVCRATTGSGETKAGPHCKYCPAILRCDAVKGLLQSFGLVDPETEEGNRVAEYLALCEAAKPIVKRIEAHAKDILKNGGAVPGWKLGKPGSTREINDPFAAFTLLEGKQLIKREEFLSILSVGVGDIEKAIAKINKLKPKEAKDTVNAILLPIIDFKPKEPSLEKAG